MLLAMTIKVRTVTLLDMENDPVCDVSSASSDHTAADGPRADMIALRWILVFRHSVDLNVFERDVEVD